MKKINKKAIIKWSLFVLLIVATVLIFAFSNQIFGRKVGVNEDGSIIWDPAPMFEGKTYSDNAFIQYLCANAVPNLLKSIRIIGVAVALGVALHYLAKITFHSQKGLTVSKLVVSFLKWVIAIASAFFIMDAWGADTTTMIASAGVVTLIIGLGSQSLVADILAGIFIVFEGEFQVGDIVIVDGWRGEVREIGVRTTKLVDAGGNIKIVNNSEIKTIINQTQELSLAKCYMSIAYGVPIEKAEAVFADNIENIKKNIPAIVEGPYYKGVSELTDSSVNLLFVAKCKESDIYQVQRDLNRELKLMLDKNDIEIPFNQLVVHMAEDRKKEEATKKETKKAKAFNEEQSELSKDIQVKNEQ